MEGRLVRCAGCDAPVDALRAGHVAVLSEEIRYFCDTACRSRTPRPRSRAARVTTPREPRVPEARAVVEARAELAVAPVTRAAPSPAAPTLPPAAPIEASGAEAPAGGEEPTDADALLLVTAWIAGVLTVALTLLGTAKTVTFARAAVAVVGAIALGARAATRGHDPAGGRPALMVLAPAAAALVAVVARLRDDAAAGEITSIAGVMVAVAAVLAALAKRAREAVDAERRWVEAALSLPGRRVGRDDVTVIASHELRPGEELRVEAGEIVPADMTITRGAATVLPWLGATTPAARKEGDPLVAGARIVESAVEGIAGWTGFDRAWARLVLDPARRADVRSAPSRIALRVAEQGALAAAGLAALATFANAGRALDVIVAALAAFAALATPAVAGLPGVHLIRGVLAAARRGIAYRSAEAWDACARASSAVFLARGTLLLGEPDVVEVEPTGAHEPARILAWIAGAEAGQTHPLAVAVARAASQRGVLADAVRSPHVAPGLGVRAVTGTGEELLVGSRALMLDERVSIALHEGRVAELEALGRTVVLVAVGGRLAGLVALQDGLRPGARAAVQHVLDVEIEPVLLSGDARETCEAIGRALDIDHVRPEVLPADRATEVRRLSEGGARVAVIGRPATDAPALQAADVAVALGAAGGSPSEWSVTLASDDVRDAALALALAKRTHAEARTALVLSVAPGIVGALAVSFGLLPPVFAPLAGLIGGAVATLHARATAPGRGEPRATPWDLVVPTPP